MKRNGTRRKTVKFRTTLQCDGCVRKVQPRLENIPGIENWDVRLNSSKKVLKVVVPSHTERETADQIIQALDKEGYAAEKMN